MENEKRPGYYAVIPAEIRYDRKLTPNARLLYAEITALLNEDGFCFASNAYFAELYDVKERTVSSWISELRKQGYITVCVDRDTDGKVVCRKIRVAASVQDGQPVEEIFHTPGKGFREGMEENFQYTNLSNTNIDKENKKESPPGEKPKRSRKTDAAEAFDPMPMFRDWIAQIAPAEWSSAMKNELYCALARFCAQRKERRKPIPSKPSVAALCNKLMRYSDGHYQVMIDMLDAATIGGWLSVYPPKGSPAAPAADPPKEETRWL